MRQVVSRLFRKLVTRLAIDNAGGGCSADHIANLKPTNPPNPNQDSTAKRKLDLSQLSIREFKQSKMEMGFYGEYHLIWIDCEMTHLDPEKGQLLEIACIITAPDLYEVSRLPSIIINASDEVLANMDPWCIKQHGESGLTQASRESTITTAQAEQMLLKFVRNYTKGGCCPMAGNSIFSDRLFIMKNMPDFHKHFHYRNVDVSSIKELVRRWYPKVYGESPQKKFLHRTLSDIEDSIAELNFYRRAVFKK